MRTMPIAWFRRTRPGRRQLLAGGLALAAGLALLAGCTTLDEQQRRWIFQPSDRTWAAGLAAAEGMQDVWIACLLYTSRCV